MEARQVRALALSKPGRSRRAAARRMAKRYLNRIVSHARRGEPHPGLARGSLACMRARASPPRRDGLGILLGRRRRERLNDASPRERALVLDHGVHGETPQRRRQCHFSARPRAQRACMGPGGRRMRTRERKAAGDELEGRTSSREGAWRWY